jgi:hypothetical protein
VIDRFVDIGGNNFGKYRRGNQKRTIQRNIVEEKNQKNTT